MIESLSKELISTINTEQRKAELNVEYYRGAADGIKLLMDKLKEHKDEQERKNNTAPVRKKRARASK